MLVDSNLFALLRIVVGETAARELCATLAIRNALLGGAGNLVPRGTIAFALNAVLFHHLLQRVPSGAAYVADRLRDGHRIVFDHGALRTVHMLGSVGVLPSGEAAVTRILLPLGYRLREVYPLERLRMTGRSYAHIDAPEDIPQYFVSELHVRQFPDEFQATALRVFNTSCDPLSVVAQRLLAECATNGGAALKLASAALPDLAACFACQHAPPLLDDYELLLHYSRETAWIATEGNSFNHATDRVADAAAIAEEQRARGRAVKDRLEVSRSGRIRQTALRADPVLRTFRTFNGETIVRQVPGSFFEFISRDRLQPDSPELDLGFDSANAQGIFRMTEVLT